MTPGPSFTDLSDDQLIIDVKRLAADERQATTHLIACLAEVDARRLYLGEGCSSLFTYCTQVLHLSEHAAYGRIEAARAARRFPAVLDLLTRGDLTLTALCLLRPHLTNENCAELLGLARHKTKREVEQLVAAIQPKPDVPSQIRKLPQPTPTVPPHTTHSLDGQADTPETSCTTMPGPTFEFADAAHVQPLRPEMIAPLAPARYSLQVTLSREGHDRLRRLQDLLRHRIPNADPAAIIERALEMLLERTERQRLASVQRPRTAGRPNSRSRHVPAAVRREVWKRDDGRCAFIGREGRCCERAFLELHHVVPYVDGGATTVENLQLRCRAHNGYEAERWERTLFVYEARASSAPISTPPACARE